MNLFFDEAIGDKDKKCDTPSESNTAPLNDQQHLSTDSPVVQIIFKDGEYRSKFKFDETIDELDLKSDCKILSPKTGKLTFGVVVKLKVSFLPYIIFEF